MARRLNLSPSQQARLRKQIGDFYLQGWAQHEIAEEVKVSRPTVTRELAWWQKQWEKEHIASIQAGKLRELQRIDRIERTSWAAWERSCKDAETLHTKTEGQKDKKGNLLPTKTIQEKTIKGQAGDPRFIERIGWCVEQRCKILGLYAPQKISPVNPDGTPYKAYLNWDPLTIIGPMSPTEQPGNSSTIEEPKS